MPAGHQTTTYGHGRSLKFVQNLFWWLTSISVALMWYLGKLPSLVKSEVWVNIGLYLFLAVMESHEEASLSKPREQERATKIALRSKNDDDLPSFSDFDEISQEMELHRQMSRRVGARTAPFPPPPPAIPSDLPSPRQPATPFPPKHLYNYLAKGRWAVP